jgi:hypothetical protein
LCGCGSRLCCSSTTFRGWGWADGAQAWPGLDLSAEADRGGSQRPPRPRVALWRACHREPKTSPHMPGCAIPSPSTHRMPDTQVINPSWVGRRLIRLPTVMMPHMIDPCRWGREPCTPVPNHMDHTCGRTTSHSPCRFSASSTGQCAGSNPRQDTTQNCSPWRRLAIAAGLPVG